MTTEFFPEQTIRYKTYAKETLVQALTDVFTGHPDQLIQTTKATIEFPRTEVDYPCVVVRFFERELFNAGVAHQEHIFVNGESDSVETVVVLPEGGSVQLVWSAIPNATGYKIYRGTAPGQEATSFLLTGNSFTDVGQAGTSEVVPTEVTAILDTPAPTAVAGPGGSLFPGTYYYRVTALAPSQVAKFGHYFYTADIELAIYALSSYDRDLIADTLVQIIAMGTLDGYTNTFFDRVYPKNDLFPDSELHFINVNSDKIQGFGENQQQTPWGAEDDLMYLCSYRFGVFGELYSLPPKLTYGLVRKITALPWIDGLEPEPTGNPQDPTPWVTNDPFS